MSIIAVFSGVFCHADEVSRGVAQELGYAAVESLFHQAHRNLKEPRCPLIQVVKATESQEGKR